jgi:hypothetical protein
VTNGFESKAMGTIGICNSGCRNSRLFVSQNASPTYALFRVFGCFNNIWAPGASAWLFFIPLALLSANCWHPSLSYHPTSVPPHSVPPQRPQPAATTPRSVNPFTHRQSELPQSEEELLSECYAKTRNHDSAHTHTYAYALTIHVNATTQPGAISKYCCYSKVSRPHP